MAVTKLEIVAENCGCGCEPLVRVPDNGCDNPKCICDPCTCPPPCRCGEE